MRRTILFSILAVTLALTLVSTFTAIAHAGFAYQLDSNFPSGVVPSGATVIVTASTNNTNVFTVQFIWEKPDGSKMLDLFVPIQGGMASSTSVVSDLGQWKVYAIFCDALNNPLTPNPIPIPVKIEVITFNVVPEIPVLGTTGAAIAMTFGLAYKLKRKSQKPVIP
jgi:hypothetical protein